MQTLSSVSSVLPQLGKIATHFNRSNAVGISLTIATLVAVLDYWTGDEFPLIICYLPSVIIICWISSLAVGVALAMTCCSVWAIDDVILLESHAITAIQIWTAVTHFMFFLVIIGMLMRLRAAHAREAHFARTDGLTGLTNHTAFREIAEREVLSARRLTVPLAVAYLDCDNFKSINDTHGHNEGDRLLKTIGQSLQQHVRAVDTAARMGGDEFAILLPGATERDAKLVVQRVREQLQDVMTSNDWPVTFSIGVVVYETVPESVDELIRHSDLMMFDVKRQQKNAVAYKLCI